MKSVFVIATVAALGMVLPASAEEVGVGVGVGPVGAGVTVGTTGHYHRDHDRTTIIKEREPRDKTVIIKKRERSPDHRVIIHEDD
ncbi:MAG: hypothetical protein ACTHM2_09575 [Afipia sp.]|jgi:hypothetical protein